jgi:hypothetical protein
MDAKIEVGQTWRLKHIPFTMVRVEKVTHANVESRELVTGRPNFHSASEWLRDWEHVDAPE